MSGYSVSSYKVMIQKAMARGFEGAFYEDEKAAAMQLLWEHLAGSADQVAAVAELRRELNDQLTAFSNQLDLECKPPQTPLTPNLPAADLQRARAMRAARLSEIHPDKTVPELLELVDKYERLQLGPDGD